MDSNYLELKLFLNLKDSELAEVLEKLEALQDIETFRELKKEILLKYESQKAIEEKIIYESINCPNYLIN
jgi:hypothetical protein|tara:strand:- start:205 stop:414 length:210 start_codon:yes stop_codon:yes gene_type:complete